MRIPLLARLASAALLMLPPAAAAQATARSTSPAGPVPARNTGSHGTPRPAATQSPPRLVVFITVDQLIPAYFDRWASQFTGGLARLARHGAYFTQGYQDHAVTETAPGHASTLSGRHPRSTGIVANDRGVFDEQAPVIGGGGPGASPYRFRGSVLYDWMRAADPAAKSLSVSRKDRGAILPLGRAGRDVYWYTTTGRMSTSTWYGDTLPSWVQAFNARRIPQAYAGREWTLLLPAEAYAEPDSVDEEAAGGAYLFPHRLTDDTLLVTAAFAGVPAMDEMLLQFALAGVEAMGLGAAPRTDLLAVSLSTTDAVGHRFGPDSREIHDQVLRLDRALGTFIDSLYRMRDSATIAFALTADHGVASYPEIYARRNGLAVPRADLNPLLTATAAALEARGVPASALTWDWGMVYPDRAALRRGGLDPDSVIAAFAAELRKVPGVARVDDPRTFAASDTATDSYARRWFHMIPPDFDVPVVASLEPGAYWGAGTSATHGTPHDYDAHVPVIFYGPWFVSARHAERVSVVDMAPTLARILDVKPTEPLDGRVLERALRPQ